MKRFISSLKGRLVNGIKQGISAYVKTFSNEDPRLTLHIFGWLKKIGSGLWNGVKGAVGGFFGGGGGITLKGGEPLPAGAPIIITEPKGTEPTEKKPNIILYVGIGVGVIMLIIVLMMVLRRK